MKPIALDAMSGDYMPEASVEGAMWAAAEGVSVILVGDKVRLEEEFDKRGSELPVVHASDVIEMDDHAADVRRRRDSSISVAMHLVRDGEASGCISMGHSGATMAAALLILGRIKGIDRPAILTSIPAGDHYVGLLDAGANADCRPRYLQQFAVMGSLYAQDVLGRERPTVGLLSIGEESHKGNELTREAHRLLIDTPGIAFYGNIEGRDLFAGTTDVVVTDGFTGNVALKLAEGEAKALFAWIREALNSSAVAKLGALLVRSALRRVAKRLDPAEYGAQPLLGVDGYAFIGHGSSSSRAVYSALKSARDTIESGVAGTIASGMASLEDATPIGPSPKGT
ncbi:MAG: phosphate acyltransferase PlsX [Truepera sp.]|nr:phosphate acyltransferase PlsX [Truepera sp.]